MFKTIIAGLFCALMFCGVSFAQTCPAYTYTLTNGTTADANQVMANFNTVRTCVNSISPQVLRGYIAGLTLSTAGSSATFGVSSGVATDSTAVSSLALASAYTKTTGAWTVGSGSGCLDTGTIANNTWYSEYLIQRTDTGVVDILCSTSATSPTLPSPYTLYRRVGSMKTDGSSNWKAFIQNGDQFLWVTPVEDLINTSVPTALANVTLASVPNGVQTLAVANTYWQGGTGAAVTTGGLFPPAVTGANLIGSTGVANWIAGSSAGSATISVMTDTAQHLALIGSASSIQLWLNTLGWIDTRGKNN